MAVSFASALSHTLRLIRRFRKANFQMDVGTLGSAKAHRTNWLFLVTDPSAQEGLQLSVSTLLRTGTEGTLSLRITCSDARIGRKLDVTGDG